MEKEFFYLIKKDWLVTPAMVNASKNKKSLDHMYCHISGVSGTQYADSIPSRVARNVTYGELKPDPHNEYDPNAIEVWHGNTMLGWVPARYAEKLAPCIAYLRQKGNKCLVPVEVEDFTDHYAQFLEDPWFDIEEKREMRKRMFHFSIQLPTFWTLFIGFRIASCFEELDIIWDHLSEIEKESIRKEGPVSPIREHGEEVPRQQAFSNGFPFIRTKEHRKQLASSPIPRKLPSANSS